MADTDETAILRIHTRIVSITSYLFLMVYIADQLTKKWALDTLHPSYIIPVTSFFDFTLAWNHGLTANAFGYDLAHLISDILITFGLVVFLIFNRWRLETKSILVAMGIGFTMGGIFGNLTDRLRVGASIDFIDFHAFGYHWPSFNLADIAIVIGIIFLALDAMATDNPADENS